MYLCVWHNETVLQNNIKQQYLKINSLTCKEHISAYNFNNILGPFTNFVVSPCYSRSELYGGAVTASFSKYLHWKAMHFLQRSTHFSKTELLSF
jgi:hypothetical protein